MKCLLPDVITNDKMFDLLSIKEACKIFNVSRKFLDRCIELYFPEVREKDKQVRIYPEEVLLLLCKMSSKKHLAYKYKCDTCKRPFFCSKDLNKEKVFCSDKCRMIKKRENVELTSNALNVA